MKTALRTGFSFGLTSGIITTLGLMVGLEAGTQSKVAVTGGILTIAIADAFSDALGIHISEEAKNRSSSAVWLATFSTLTFKFFFAASFLVPVLFYPLSQAIIINLCWGFSLLAVYSYFIAYSQKKSPAKVVGEHLLVSILVVALSYGSGRLIHQLFAL